VLSEYSVRVTFKQRRFGVSNTLINAYDPFPSASLRCEVSVQLDSGIADLNNLGGPNAGSIPAALFPEEFVDGHPWAHGDIAGKAQVPAARGWRNNGPTGFGPRLRVEPPTAFRVPAGADRP